MAQAQKKPEEERPEERRHLREVKPEEERGEEEQPVEGRRPTSGVAVAGLVLAAVSLFLPAIFAFIGGIAGAILGLTALSAIRRGENTGNYVAWGAIVLGSIVTLLAFIVMIGALA